jgi:hypothetical protein
VALSITHALVSAVVDDGVAGEVGPSEWNAAHTVGGTLDAGDVSGAGDLTKTDDTNVTLTLGGTPTGALLKATSITVGWSGTLAAARLNANVVQAVTNDTNVTGSIATQTLTLGWTGTLAATRGGTGLSSLGTGVATWLGTPSSANLAAAITDETGSGALVFGTSPGFTTAANPVSNDGAALGTTALQWSDLFLAEGGVINWDNGDLLVTQTGNTLAFSGGTAYVFDGGFVGPNTTDASALGSTSNQWADLFLAEGGVINWDNGDATLTQAGNVVTLAGASLSLADGQLAFPATQNASADANTLDDYEEGTWTPVFTFATPGNLSVVYSTQSGDYTKVGREVRVSGQTIMSTFTHTTASGGAQLTGLPFTAANTGHSTVGSSAWTGVTKAGYTQVGSFIIFNQAIITWFAFASASAVSPVSAADMPTGGTPNLSTTCCYHI